MIMPNFTKRLETISNYRYKIKFMDDGYPGKDLGDVVTCHPIYGVYVIRDYLYQFKKTKDTKYQIAAMRVANAAIHRMENFKNTKVFWYKSDSFINPKNKDYYSGLTQSYYAEVFAQLYASTKKEKYKEAAKQVFSSLKIPVNKGGVCHHSVKGPSIQEYPMEPNGYILNGWLSAISSIKKYADITEDKDATKFWNENLNTLSNLLPLYDAPEFANSRYTLNGSTTIKIQSTADNLELQEIHLNVPGEGTFELLVDSKKDDEHYIDANSVIKRKQKVFTKNQSALFNVSLSRFSYPETNEIMINFISKNTGFLNLSMIKPTYSPKSMKPGKSFVLLDKIPIQIGENFIKVKLPWQHLDALGTPTTFKQLGSKWHNVYHFIHINRLEEFYNITKDKRLLKYLNKWKTYVDSWSNNPLYNGLETVPFKK
ncbi:D-glucuronyl C5-epimerase family protein [Oceanobacillus sp. Castelsardo]|uniref:D-glucuronyl C5-epimerase family protein n=1 Tax=Oceanobacillus sp. Castelsardo TaxID=1851204 RepID=UPI0008382497|nr:D-glucuronyl C5-epimerase family protein [Oceanobacillus sp. Castelsardo]